MCQVILALFLLSYYVKCIDGLNIAGIYYLFDRGVEGDANSYKNDGISWMKKNKSEQAGREREDYLLHRSGVLCSFKAYDVASVSKCLVIDFCI